MALKIRLARGGAKKRPIYRIVVAEISAPRDGRFIEKIGSYNPMVAKDHPHRLTINLDRAKHWLSVGALPTDRVARFLGAHELVTAPSRRETPLKSAPKKKAQERLKAAEDASAKAAEAAAAPPPPLPAPSDASEPAADATA